MGEVGNKVRKVKNFGILLKALEIFAIKVMGSH